MGRNSGRTKEIKGHRHVSEPKKIILWQKDIKVSIQEKEAFVHRVVKEYYGPYFEGRNITEITEWINNIIENKKDSDGQGNVLFSLPLIAGLDRKAGWEEYKVNKKEIYFFKPFPSFEDNSDDSSVDAVFSEGDKIIETLFNDESNLSIQKEFDSARDKEKKSYFDLLENFKKVTKDCSSPDKESLEIIKKLEKQTKKLEEEINSLKKDLEKANNKLDDADKEKRRAIEKCEEQWQSKFDKLEGIYQETKKQSDNYKQKWVDEERKRKEHELTIASREQTIAERDVTIKRMQEESSLYSKRVVFFISAQAFAQRAMRFFDAYDQLLSDANQLKTNMPSKVNADDYNYYLMRIERKFYGASSKIVDLPSWRRELQLLANTGLVPAGGLIDKKIGSNKVKEQQWESTLRMLIYQSVMCHLAGASVVMSDEFALMLPKMVKGVNNTSHFSKTTELLQKSIADMGYDLNYVKPFTRLDAYKNVQNMEFTKADIPVGTIFEVLKMALNFGSSKSNTEVSAK